MMLDIPDNPSKAQAREFVDHIFDLIAPSPKLRDAKHVLSELEDAIKYISMGMLLIRASLPDSALKSRTETVLFRAAKTYNTATRCDQNDSNFRAFFAELMSNLTQVGKVTDYNEFLTEMTAFREFTVRMREGTDSLYVSLYAQQLDFETSRDQLPDIPNLEEAWERELKKIQTKVGYVEAAQRMVKTIDPLAEAVVDLVGTVEKEMS